MELVIGEGAQGQIRADHLSRKVVKCYALREDHKGLPPCFLREWGSLCRVAHPNVIRPTNIICTEKEVQMQLPYYKYDLAKYLQQMGGRAGKEFIINTLGQVASGLNHLHQQLIVHRDIKPSNILVGEDGQVVICDFGLAKCIRMRQPYTPKVGTYNYMAPELLSSGNYNYSVDVWALGVVLLELLLNQKPYYISNGKMNWKQRIQPIIQFFGSAHLQKIIPRKGVQGVWKQVVDEAADQLSMPQTILRALVQGAMAAAGNERVQAKAFMQAIQKL